MKITIFTRDQPRHLALVRELCRVSDRVDAILECSTVFPGQTTDSRTPVMQRYFARVAVAEHDVFGNLGFPPERVRTLAIRAGELNLLTPEDLGERLDADLIIVFGASYVKGWLVEALIARNAVNLHMGVSPYYRGAACNFWALYDGHADLVGATLHRLSRGIDSGPILLHALPQPAAVDPFLLGMLAVRAGQHALCEAIGSGWLQTLEPQPQDRALEIRYTRNTAFTDEVAKTYLERGIDAQGVASQFDSAPMRSYVHPVYILAP